MPSLPQDSPAVRLRTGLPMVRDPPSQLMGFYITTYEAAFGKRPTESPQKLEGGRVLGVEPPCDRSMHPLLGVHTGSGYVTNNYAAVSSLISPRVERQDTDVSTTADDFKLFGRADYRRMLPECVDEPACRYPADFSLSRLRFGEMRVPEEPGERGTWSRCASPAQPDVPQRTTELSGFTGTAPRSDLTLPEQPPDIRDGQMASFPDMCGTHQPAMGYPAPFAPPELQVGPKGVAPMEELPSYSAIHNRYLTELSPLAPVAPGWWAQAPIALPRSVEGIQVPSASGFSTNNHPTNLWHVNQPLK